ncbi:MAG: glycosyltransferase family 2 protein [Chitinophagaceae bacterium]
MPPVYIIILNYKKWQDTLDCLESVFQSSYRDFSVIVIDNDSQNNSLEHLMHWADKRTATQDTALMDPLAYTYLQAEHIDGFFNTASFCRLVFIQNNRNAGFAGGVNIALGALQDLDTYVWLLNPDMVVTENTLEELAAFASQQPGNAITGAVIKFYSGNRDLFFYGGFKVNFLSATVSLVKKKDSFNQLDYISGGCLFTHTSNWKRVGLLPEEYFLYWEETDWCYQAKQKGCVLRVCTTAICYDKVSTVIGKNFMANYYYARNGLLFISKFRKRNIPVVVFFLGMRFLKRIITGRWSRARGICRGTVDFFKMKRYEAK